MKKKVDETVRSLSEDLPIEETFFHESSVPENNLNFTESEECMQIVCQDEIGQSLQYSEEESFREPFYTNNNEDHTNDQTRILEETIEDLLQPSELEEDNGPNSKKQSPNDLFHQITINRKKCGNQRKST